MASGVDQKLNFELKRRQNAYRTQQNIYSTNVRQGERFLPQKACK